LFGLGFTEIFIIAVIALIFIGPKQLPAVMKTIGKFAREITKAKDEFKQTIDQDESLSSIRESVDEVKNNIQKKVDEVKTQLSSTDDEDKPKK